MHRQRFEICECSTGFGVKTRSKIFATKNALHINLNRKLVRSRLNINWTIVVTRRRVTSACISSERGSVFKAPQKTSVFRLVVQVPLVSFTFNSDNLWTHHAMIFRVKQKFFIRREGKSADSFIRDISLCTADRIVFAYHCEALCDWKTSWSETASLHHEDW